MKKFLIVLIVLLLSFSLIGCNKNKNEDVDDDSAVIKVVLPSGTPLMAIGTLLDNPKYEFTIVNGQDPLQAAFLENEYDLIIAPFNLGAKLYLAGKSTYQILSIITTNNTYIMSRTEISDLSELNGKKIMTYGTGSSPWIAYKALASKYNLSLEEVSQSSASDVSNLFATGSTEADVFLGAEPNITVLKEKKKLDFYVINVCDYLKDEADYFIQACIFVKKDCKISDKSIQRIEEAVRYANDKPAAYASNVLEKNDFFKTLGEEVIEKAIENCNITYLKAKDNKAVIEKFCSLLNKYSPKVLDGKKLDDAFYF